MIQDKQYFEFLFDPSNEGARLYGLESNDSVEVVARLLGDSDTAQQTPG